MRTIIKLSGKVFRTLLRVTVLFGDPTVRTVKRPPGVAVRAANRFVSKFRIYFFNFFKRILNGDFFPKQKTVRDCLFFH